MKTHPVNRRHEQLPSTLAVFGADKKVMNFACGTTHLTFAQINNVVWHVNERWRIELRLSAYSCHRFFVRRFYGLTESRLAIPLYIMSDLPLNPSYALSMTRALSGLKPLGPRNPAEKAVERLGEEIASFEQTLSGEEEVGGIIIGAPGGTSFHIVKFYHLNMDILVFEGLNEYGKPQRLLQHITQLSILLTALPKLNDTPRRIGFNVEGTPPSS